MLVISVLVITIAIWCNDEVRSHSGCLPRASSHVCNGDNTDEPLATIQERARLPPNAAAGAARSPGAPPVGRPLTTPARSAGESRREKPGVPPQCLLRRPGSATPRITRESRSGKRAHRACQAPCQTPAAGHGSGRPCVLIVKNIGELRYWVSLPALARCLGHARRHGV